MTCPPTPPPLFSASHHIAPYPSPTSITSTFASDIDSSSWTAMSPHEEVNRSITRKPRLKSGPSKKTTGKSNVSTLVFVTGGTPDEMKSKENMSKVRKKAMISYLETEKGGDTLRANSVGSDQSQSSSSNRAPATRSQDVTGQRKRSTAIKQPTPADSLAPAVQDLGLDTGTITERSIQKHPNGSPIVVTIFGPTIEEKGAYPFDTRSMPPLVSLGEQFDPFRTMFRSSNPHVRVEEIKLYCSRIFGTRGLGKYWIPLCIKYAHTFLGTLLMASAHYDTIYNYSVESYKTAALRQDIIHLVSASLTDSGRCATDDIIMALHQLIVGEIIMGRSENILTWHQAGIEELINRRGGLKALGVSGYLASAVSWAHLASKILNGTKPRPMFFAYSNENSMSKYHVDATIPESPIYRPHDQFRTLRRPGNCKKETLELLENMHMMIETFLREPEKNPQCSPALMKCYHTIIQYPSVGYPRRENGSTQYGSTLEVYRYWKHEAIRITALVLAEAIFHKIPLSDVIGQVGAPKEVLPSAVYTSSVASHSTDSLVSPLDPPYETPMTDNATSPSYTSYDASPTRQSSFPFAHRPSNASTNTTWSIQRPSVCSRNSSEQFFVSEPCRTASIGPHTLFEARDALRNSNLSNCWGDMAGVLLWISLVMGAASREDSDSGLLKRYYSATAMRALCMLCFDHREAMHSTTLKMEKIVERLGTYDQGPFVRKDSGTSTKRIKS